MKLGQFLGILMIGSLAGAVAATATLRLAPVATDEARVKEIVNTQLAQLPQPDPATASAQFGQSIEEFLVGNPRVLERVSAALAVEREAEQRATTKALIDERRDEIFGGTDAVVVGNVDGDVTLVEFYDYNCSYCRQVMPEVAALLAEDPDLKLVLRQFPILSAGSVDAARVGVVAANEGVDYWAFHQAMFTGRGQANLEKALAQAASLGIDDELIRAKLGDADTVLAASAKLARDLGINGTPAFILADEIIPGAVGVEVLRDKIANVRSCGSTACS